MSNPSSDRTQAKRLVRLALLATSAIGASGCHSDHEVDGALGHMPGLCGIFYLCNPDGTPILEPDSPAPGHRNQDKPQARPSTSPATPGATSPSPGMPSP